MLVLGRNFLCAFVIAMHAPALAFAWGASKDAVVFDMAGACEYRDVTPADFKSSDGRRVLQFSFSISNRFNKPESEIDHILYSIRFPTDVEVADFLPKTALDTDVVGPVSESGASESETEVTVQLGGELGAQFLLGKVVTVGGKIGADRESRTRDQVSHSWSLQRLPAKQAVTASGTLDRRQGVYFKLRPFSQATLEGEKRLVALCVVPANWESKFVLVECAASDDARERIISGHESIVLRALPEGSTDEQDRQSQLDKFIAATNAYLHTPSAQNQGVVHSFNPTIGFMLALDRAALPRHKFVGRYRVDIRGDKFPDLFLKADGTWEAAMTAKDGSEGKGRGMWEIDEHCKVRLIQREYKDWLGRWKSVGEPRVLLNHDVFDWRGWPDSIELSRFEFSSYLRDDPALDPTTNEGKSALRERILDRDDLVQLFRLES